MNLKKPSTSTGILLVLIIVAMFSFAFLRNDTGILAGNSNSIKISGMATKEGGGEVPQVINVWVGGERYKAALTDYGGSMRTNGKETSVDHVYSATIDGREVYFTRNGEIISSGKIIKAENIGESSWLMTEYTVRGGRIIGEEKKINIDDELIKINEKTYKSIEDFLDNGGEISFVGDDKNKKLSFKKEIGEGSNVYVIKTREIDKEGGLGKTEKIMVENYGLVVEVSEETAKVIEDFISGGKGGIDIVERDKTKFLVFEREVGDGIIFTEEREVRKEGLGESRYIKIGDAENEVEVKVKKEVATLVEGVINSGGSISLVEDKGHKKLLLKEEIKEKSGVYFIKTKEIDKEGGLGKTEKIMVEKDGNKVEVDREAASLIGSAVAKDIDVILEGGENSRILFKDGGRVVEEITYYGDYKIENNKLSGIKTHTYYSYSLDKNHDGKVSKEEEETKEYIGVISGFVAKEEEDGKTKGLWSAGNFRWVDGRYIGEVVGQRYDKDSRVVGEEYYYIEKEGDGIIKIDIVKGKDKEIGLTSSKGTVIKVENKKAYKYDKNTGEYKDISNTEEGKRAIETNSLFRSRRWFSNLEFHLTAYKGLSGWSQLIFSKETLNRWREAVDKIFATTYLGTRYWASAICSSYIPKSEEGILTMETSDELFDIIAHVEGERSMPIVGPNGSVKYIYKITFAVRNPKNSKYEKLKFNVYLYGDRKVKLYPEDIEVKDGRVFSRGGGKYEKNKGRVFTDMEGPPIVQYSDYFYDIVCIEFDNTIYTGEREIVSEVCNRIVEYQGSPEEYKGKVVSGGVTSGSGIKKYEEADF